MGQLPMDLMNGAGRLILKMRPEALKASADVTHDHKMRQKG